MPDCIILRTQRLQLEPLQEGHAPLLFAGLSDEALYWFISEPRPGSVEALATRFRRLSTRRSPDGRDAWLNWAAWSELEQRWVGWLQATVQPDATAMLAYILFRDAWGRGFAREAVEGVVGHLRDAWAVRIVRATVDTRNQRSVALLEALGFVRGAVTPNAEVLHGVASDEVRYSRQLG